MEDNNVVKLEGKSGVPGNASGNTNDNHDSEDIFGFFDEFYNNNNGDANRNDKPKEKVEENKVNKKVNTNDDSNKLSTGDVHKELDNLLFGDNDAGINPSVTYTPSPTMIKMKKIIQKDQKKAKYIIRTLGISKKEIQIAQEMLSKKENLETKAGGYVVETTDKNFGIHEGELEKFEQEGKEMYANLGKQEKVQVDGLYTIVNRILGLLNGKYGLEFYRTKDREKEIRTINIELEDENRIKSEQRMAVRIDQFKIDEAAYVTIGYLEDGKHSKVIGYQGNVSEQVDWLFWEYLKEFIKNQKEINFRIEHEHKTLEDATEDITKKILETGISKFANIGLSYEQITNKASESNEFYNQVKDKLQNHFDIFKNYFINNTRIKKGKSVIEKPKHQNIEVGEGIEAKVQAKTVEMVDLGQMLSDEGIAINPLLKEGYTYNGRNTDPVKMKVKGHDPARQIFDKYNSFNLMYNGLSTPTIIALHKIAEMKEKNSGKKEGIDEVINLVQNGTEKEKLFVKQAIKGELGYEGRYKLFIVYDPTLPPSTRKQDGITIKMYNKLDSFKGGLNEYLFNEEYNSVQAVSSKKYEEQLKRTLKGFNITLLISEYRTIKRLYNLK